MQAIHQLPLHFNVLLLHVEIVKLTKNCDRFIHEYELQQSGYD